MRQLAEHADISEAYVSLLEAAKRLPSEKLLRKLVQILAQDPQEAEQLYTALATAEPDTAPAEPPVAVPQTTRPAASSLFENLLFEVHLQLLAQNAQAAHAAQQHLTEALPKFHQPIQLQILIGFLEAARGQWQLAERALETARQAFDFCPEDISAQTLARAQELMSSLKALAASQAASLKAYLAQTQNGEDRLLRSYIAVACGKGLVRLQATPEHYRELAGACEVLLSLAEPLSDKLMPWAYDVWIEALLHSEVPASLNQALHLNRMALLQAPQQAGLWFRQSQICQALYRLSGQTAWQAECWQSLQMGLQQDPDARLDLITHAWTAPIENAGQLQALTRQLPFPS